MSDELLKGFANAETNAEKAKKELENEITRSKQKQQPEHKAQKEAADEKNTTDEYYSQKP